jgi:hypothetical protein
MTEVITPSVGLHGAFGSFNLPCCTGRKHHAPRVLCPCRRRVIPQRRNHARSPFTFCRYDRVFVLFSCLYRTLYT